MDVVSVREQQRLSWLRSTQQTQTDIPTIFFWFADLRVLPVILQKGQEEAAVLELRDEGHVALVPKDGVEEDAPVCCLLC
jgi:hypothetical protein